MSAVVPEAGGPEFDVLAFAEQSYADPPAGVRTNMVMSLDGAVSFRGRVGPLSSNTDRALFHALRALSDVVLVGAATARAERYGPVTLGEDLQNLRSRVRPDASATPPMAIVTASCELPERILAGGPAGAPRPIVITSARADTAAIGDQVDLIVAGDDEVDLPAALDQLRGRGLHKVLCEGGPTLIDRLTEDDLVDELCVTLTPQLTAEALPVARPSNAVTALSSPRRFALRHARAHNDELFLRYTRPQ